MLTSALLCPAISEAGGYPENAARVALGAPGGPVRRRFAVEVFSEEERLARFGDTR